MSALPALVSVDEYLRMVYEPDCDYVDGVVLERGRKEPCQGAEAAHVVSGESLSGLFVIQETRVQTSQTRLRVPGVCLIAGPEPDEEIFTHPPFLCGEILSPEDRMSRMHPKIGDYLAFGVPDVWVINPQTRTASIHTDTGIGEVHDGVLRTENPEITVPLDALFS